jgi:hypothetical protein
MPSGYRPATKTPPTGVARLAAAALVDGMCPVLQLDSAFEEGRGQAGVGPPLRSGMPSDLARGVWSWGPGADQIEVGRAESWARCPTAMPIGCSEGQVAAPRRWRQDQAPVDYEALSSGRQQPPVTTEPPKLRHTPDRHGAGTAGMPPVRGCDAAVVSAHDLIGVLGDPSNDACRDSARGRLLEGAKGQLVSAG